MRCGLSGCSGIILYETAKEGENAVYGYYKDGEIIVKTGEYKKLKEIKEKFEKPYKCGNDKKLRIMLIVFLIMLIICTVIFFKFPLGYFFGALILSAAAYVPVIGLCFANSNMYKSVEMRDQFRRFHGCEHALLNFNSRRRNKNKTEIKIEDLKKTSYYESECGTVYYGYVLFLLAVITIMVLNFSSLGLLKFLGILIGTVILLIINVLNPLNPFKLFQKPVVAQPSEHEYLLGIEVLKSFRGLISEAQETLENKENKERAKAPFA